MKKEKKTEKERKKRASIEASRNVRSERGPETWRRATNTLAARNAEAGVFVSVVAIFTLHPWHLALFPCPRGGCPSAVGSPCRAFPTHFSFYFSQIHPVLVLPLLVGKIRRESNSRKREREIGSSISYQRTFEPISNYSFSFSFFFSRNVPSNRNLNTFHSSPRCPRTTLISLSLSLVTNGQRHGYNFFVFFSFYCDHTHLCHILSLWILCKMSRIGTNIWRECPANAWISRNDPRALPLRGGLTFRAAKTMFKSIARTHEAPLFIVAAAFRKPSPFSHIFHATLLDRIPRSLIDASWNVARSSKAQKYTKKHRLISLLIHSLKTVIFNLINLRANISYLSRFYSRPSRLEIRRSTSLSQHTFVIIHEKLRIKNSLTMFNSLDWETEFSLSSSLDFKEITFRFKMWELVSKLTDFNAQTCVERAWIIKMATQESVCQKMENVVS